MEKRISSKVDKVEIASTKTIPFRIDEHKIRGFSGKVYYDGRDEEIPEHKEIVYRGHSKELDSYVF